MGIIPVSLMGHAAREKARKQHQKETQKQLERFDREHEARMRVIARGK